MTDSPSLSVIVFAYNEADNVPQVLQELRAYLETEQAGAEILFVDDGSSDATADAARQILSAEPALPHKVLCHDRNRGIGAALKTGVSAATAPWVTFMPADGQIEPAAIGTLRAAAQSSGADLVTSVYKDRDDGPGRKLMSLGLRALIRVIHGVQIRSDGPYLFRRELFIPEQIASDSFFLNFEFPIRVAATGRPVEVVSIHCRPRLGGRSKSANARAVARVAYELLDLRVRRTRERLRGR